MNGAEFTPDTHAPRVLAQGPPMNLQQYVIGLNESGIPSHTYGYYSVCQALCQCIECTP